MLYIVSTPIGNLGDITFRAIEILKNSNYILAEDTRRTLKLLKHYNFEKALVSFNDINKKRKTPKIIEDLMSGSIISMVSDSGTPTINDPGFYLIRECVKNNIPVKPVPGPSSVISALACSGLPTDRFMFYGFLPKTDTKKNRILSEMRDRKETAIFFESPHRLLKTLSALAESYPESYVVIAREMTKKFEEFIRGSPAELLNKLKHTRIKGELTLVVKRDGFSD